MSERNVTHDGEIRPRRWLVFSVALALLWTAELFLLQARAFEASQAGLGIVVWVHPWIRLALDVFCVAGFVFCAPRIAVGVVAVASVPFHLSLITYHDYFGHCVTVSSVTSAWREGGTVAGQILELVPWGLGAALALACLGKLWLLRAAGPSRLGIVPRLGIATCIAASYFGTMEVAQRTTKVRLHKIQENLTVDDLGVAFGYLPAWWAEWTYLTDDAALTRALERAKFKSDRLSDVQADLDLPTKIAIVQVESLDWAMLDFRTGDEPVMPFLANLASTSMLFRIRAIHDHGSADADFTMLNRKLPAPDRLNYCIVGFPYDDTLAHIAASRGYDVVFLHGVSGQFFHRREAYEQMGFSRLIFREELKRDFGLAGDPEAWMVHDRDLFRTSADLLVATDSPTLQFLITVTSHGPFDWLPAPDRALFQNPNTDAEHYLNSMRYVDDVLREWHDRLPDGTLIVFYGDHTSQVEYGAAAPGPSDEEGAEYVPCLFYVKAGDIGSQQQSRGTPVAVDGRISLLDVASYVYRQFEKLPSPPPE